MISPSIVHIFYYSFPLIVKYCHNIPLRVLPVRENTPSLFDRRNSLHIVQKLQSVALFDQSVLTVIDKGDR